MGLNNKDGPHTQSQSERAWESLMKQSLVLLDQCCVASKNFACIHFYALQM